ncbi:MAG: hypothetical protein COA65_08585 [Rhodospirillaceae bacterium]|nr:MAG: hypothetical protein COA65_08585 [Rhodospirillaceae bacterium]
MALRDQPYIPLYVQDIMTDEKLNECSASTHGIYIKGIMCLMHKSENYGTILLRQKYKQTDKQSKNFAYQLVKHLPYTVDEISNAIDELIDENVCSFDGDQLCQKRMINDNRISILRSKSGKKGGDQTGKIFALAKPQANSEYESEYVIEIVNYLNKKVSSNYSYHARNIQQLVMDRLEEKFTVKDFKKVIDNKCRDWLNTQYAKYLRPETLFSVEHFDSYLNEKQEKVKSEITII